MVTFLTDLYKGVMNFICCPSVVKMGINFEIVLRCTEFMNVYENSYEFPKATGVK